MIDYSHLCARPYLAGRTDCLGLLRGFFNPHVSTPVPNYARPSDFATENFDLFGRYLRPAGFDLIDVHPSDWRFGDVALIAWFSSVASHCAILVEDGKILHHVLGQHSTVEPYNGYFRNRTVGIVRHREFNPQIEEPVIDFASYLPAAVQERLRDA